MAMAAPNSLSSPLGGGIGAPISYSVPWASRSHHRKQDLNPFSRFCKRMTDSQKHHATGTSVATVRISFDAA